MRSGRRCRRRPGSSWLVLMAFSQRDGAGIVARQHDGVARNRAGGDRRACAVPTLAGLLATAEVTLKPWACSASALEPRPEKLGEADAGGAALGGIARHAQAVAGIKRAVGGGDRAIGVQGQGRRPAQRGVQRRNHIADGLAGRGGDADILDDIAVRALERHGDDAACGQAAGIRARQAGCGDGRRLGLEDVVEAEELREAGAAALRRIGRAVLHHHAIGAGGGDGKLAIGEAGRAIGAQRGIQRGGEAADGGAEGLGLRRRPPTRCRRRNSHRCATPDCRWNR